MKKIVTFLVSLALLLTMLGADVRPVSTSDIEAPTKKKCIGYTIVEFGKAVDCNGDTLKLVRVNGVQVLAGPQK